MKYRMFFRKTEVFQFFLKQCSYLNTAGVNYCLTW